MNGIRGLSFLIDSNIVIALEPTSLQYLEATATAAIDLQRRANEAGHIIFRHPASAADFARQSDQARLLLRRTLAQKFPLLPSPPIVPASWLEEFGHPAPQSNHGVDLAHLAAVNAQAVDYLVTEDRTLHRRAARVGLSESVLRLEDALLLLRSFSNETVPPPPAVQAVKAHNLDPRDPIFASLRLDYAGFDDWLERCRKEHRDAWIVEGPQGLAAVAITKHEIDGGDSGWPDPTLKICTFKVAEEHGGFRFGELLLKTLFEVRRSVGVDTLYLTTHLKQVELIGLLRDFGFATGPSKGDEVVLRKRFLSQPPADTDPFDFHVKHGPPAVRLDAGTVFLVPIQPAYHRMLFPEAEEQVTLFAGSDPFGNALKKAYLCRSPNRHVRRGATLLFYRSHDVRGVTAIGVVEQALISGDSAAVARFVARRTVFPLSEIIEMSQSGDILALLFRQDRLLPRPIPITELVQHGVAKDAPMSIQAVPQKGVEWLRPLLQVQP